MASTSQTMDIEENKMAERDKEIDKLFLILKIILEIYGTEENKKILDALGKGIVDLDESSDLAGVLMTVFTCLRKEVNDPAGHQRYKAYTANIMNKEISIASIVDAIKAKKIEIDFMIATPIVELMTLFKSSFDEVRTGVTRFKVRENVAKRSIKRDASGKAIGRKSKAKENTQNITQYGLNNHHVPLLQGITFAPERRTGVIRSLGPMSQAIMMVMEDKYYNKLQSAMANSLQMLPMASEVINCLKEAKTPGSVAGILKELGDILIMTTARSTQKVYFPLLLLFLMWETKKNPYAWSFSGAPIIKLYTDIVNSGMKFVIRTKGDPIKTSQVIFHAMFGTYLDDLEICEQITMNTGKWFQRREVNSVFLKRSEASPITVNPIKFRYVTKMAQALMTKSLGNIDPVDTCRPSFSGIRKRGFTQEFLNYLRTGKSSHCFSSDPIQLQYALKKTKDQVMEDLENVKLLQAGTT